MVVNNSVFDQSIDIKCIRWFRTWHNDEGTALSHSQNTIDRLTDASRSLNEEVLELVNTLIKRQADLVKVLVPRQRR